MLVLVQPTLIQVPGAPVAVGGMCRRQLAYRWRIELRVLSVVYPRGTDPGVAALAWRGRETPSSLLNRRSSRPRAHDPGTLCHRGADGHAAAAADNHVAVRRCRGFLLGLEICLLEAQAGMRFQLDALCLSK